MSTAESALPLESSRPAERQRPGGRQRRGGRHLAGGRHLPAPPTDAEKLSYCDRNLALITRGSLASFGALLISQFRFIFLSPVFAWSFLPFVSFTLAYYLISLCVNFGTRGFDEAAHDRLVASWKPAAHPSLDVLLPICGEPIEVLRNTWVHVFELARAYRGTTTVHVLDDGADVLTRALAMDFGFTYHVRPDRGWMKKSGNLRHGYASTGGDFILILDADFAPRADLPAEMLPYFSADPLLGIVQSPQYFRTRERMSWTERGAGAVQELFYRLVQVSRDRHDGAICVGSCAIYRRVALDANGGTTLIEHSEDVHTGFDLRRKGWGLRYIPVPLATGLCPPDPDSFLTQQYRWCAGSMSLLASRKFWSTRMRLRTRFCYLSGFCYYVHTALFTFVVPAIPLVMLIVLPERVRLVNYLFIAPSIVYNLVIFPAWHHCRFGPSALMAKLLYGWAHLFAIADHFRGRRMGWQTTGSGRRKSGTRRMWIGLTVWNGGTSIAWLSLAVWRFAERGTAFIPLVCTGFVACFVTAMALAARRNYARLTEGAIG
jgi:cellulose synthase (UDP-forming)